MSHQSVFHIDRHKPPGESLSRPFELGSCSVLQGVLPYTGLRGYRMRSAICLPVCELALSLSFPEVQPRAPAVYNTIRNPSAVFCGEMLDKGETKPRGANRIQLLKTQHFWRTSSEEIFFSFAAEKKSADRIRFVWRES